MHHTKLGRTGLRVSKLCLGTMTFGLQCDAAQSNAIMDAAAAGGIDFFDAADVYPLGGGHNTAGRTEQIVGDWLKGKRQQFIVATKCVGQMGPKPWDLGMSRKHILDAIDASLRAPRHGLHRSLPAARLRPAHADRRGAGGARHRRALGQGALRRRLQLAGLQGRPRLGRSEVKNIGRIESVQPRYNLLFRSFERDLLPLCAEEAIAVIPYNPLAGGLLTGKHDRKAPPPEGSRFQLGTAGARYQARYWHDREFETIDALRARGRGSGHDHGHPGDALGAVPSGDHRADRGRQPARAAGRQPGRRRARRAAGRSQDEAR